MIYEIYQEVLTFAQETLGWISVKLPAIMNEICHGFLQSLEDYPMFFLALACKYL
jgi:hypothetical protein